MPMYLGEKKKERKTPKRSKVKRDKPLGTGGLWGKAFTKLPQVMAPLLMGTGGAKNQTRSDGVTYSSIREIIETTSTQFALQKSS